VIDIMSEVDEDIIVGELRDVTGKDETKSEARDVSVAIDSKHGLFLSLLVPQDACEATTVPLEDIRWSSVSCVQLDAQDRNLVMIDVHKRSIRRLSIRSPKAASIASSVARALGGTMGPETSFCFSKFQAIFKQYLSKISSDLPTECPKVSVDAAIQNLSRGNPVEILDRVIDRLRLLQNSVAMSEKIVFDDKDVFLAEVGLISNMTVKNLTPVLKTLFESLECSAQALALALYWVIERVSNSDKQSRLGHLEAFMSEAVYPEMMNQSVKDFLFCMILEHSVKPDWFINSKKLEAMVVKLNQRVHNFDGWNVLLSALKLSRNEMKEMILKDINILIVKTPENALDLCTFPNWQSQLIEVMTDFDQPVTKLALNILAMVHFHQFTHLEHATEPISKSLLLMSQFAEKYPDKYSILHPSRLLLTIVLRLQSSVPLFSGSYHGPIFVNLREFMDLCRHYICCSPHFGSEGFSNSEHVFSSREAFGFHYHEGRLTDFELVCETDTLLKMLRFADGSQVQLPMMDPDEKDLFEKMQRRSGHFNDAIGIMLILQFKERSLSVEENSDVARKFIAHRTLSRRLQSIVFPLMDRRSHPSTNHLKWEDVDSILCKHYFQNAKSLREVVDSKLKTVDTSIDGDSLKSFSGSEFVQVLVSDRYVLSEEHALMVANVLIACCAMLSIDGSGTSNFLEKKSTYVLFNGFKFEKWESSSPDSELESRGRRSTSIVSRLSIRISPSETESPPSQRQHSRSTSSSRVTSPTSSSFLRMPRFHKRTKDPSPSSRDSTPEVGAPSSSP